MYQQNKIMFFIIVLLDSILIDCVYYKHDLSYTAATYTDSPRYACYKASRCPVSLVDLAIGGATVHLGGLSYYVFSSGLEKNLGFFRKSF